VSRPKRFRITRRLSPLGKQPTIPMIMQKRPPLSCLPEKCQTPCCWERTRLETLPDEYAKLQSMTSTAPAMSSRDIWINPQPGQQSASGQELRGTNQDGDGTARAYALASNLLRNLSWIPIAARNGRPRPARDNELR